MVQSEVTPTIVAGVCDPGDPTTTGLTEAGYNTCPIVARAEEPECYPKTSDFEPRLHFHPASAIAGLPSSAETMPQSVTLRLGQVRHLVQRWNRKVL
jgi:hypothetical protein